MRYLYLKRTPNIIHWIWGVMKQNVNVLNERLRYLTVKMLYVYILYSIFRITMPTYAHPVPSIYRTKYYDYKMYT